MKHNHSTFSMRPLALAVLLAVATPGVQADERTSLEELRQTTLNLINALVESGALTRDKGLSSGNTQNDLSQLRLRVRLGVEAKLSDQVSTGLRIATGSSSSATSTTQTLGSNFNKYSLWLDRGFIRYDPVRWAELQTGR